MTNTEESTAVRIAPASEGPQYTAQITFLVTPETQAFILGTLIADDARSQGTVARAMLNTAIESFRAVAGEDEYQQRLAIGARELERRGA